MKKSSGGNGSSFSKGKQLGSSEGTWSTDAVFPVNYTGRRAWPVFVKYLGDLRCPLNVNPALTEAEFISFHLEEIVEPCLLNLKGCKVSSFCVEKENYFHIASVAPSIQASTCRWTPSSFSCSYFLFVKFICIDKIHLCPAHHSCVITGLASWGSQWCDLCCAALESSKPSALGFCGLLPKVAHQSYGSVKSGTSSAWEGNMFPGRLHRRLIQICICLSSLC